MKVAMGYDPNAKALAEAVESQCKADGCEVVDLGGDDPIYANTAIKVAQYVADGHAERGILLCGTGIGMSIAANKVRGAYAALLSDVYSAERAVLSNDSNIACLGAFTVGGKLACRLVHTWLGSRFVPGTPSEAKVLCYKEYDNRRGAAVKG